MRPALHHHLRQIDRALLGLLDERARLLTEVPAGDPGRAAALEDLLRRHEGVFTPDGMREVFAAIDRHCAGHAASENTIP